MHPSARVDRFGAALSILCGIHGRLLILVALPAAAHHSDVVILLAGYDSASAQSSDCHSYVPDLVAVAQRYVGTPYRFGASIHAVDCASFVQRIYRAFGVELPPTAARQFERGCTLLATELVPGDLVFFRDTYRRGISHVGIYIGRSRFIHAARGGVRIASMASRYWSRRFAGGRRIVEPAVALAEAAGAR